MPYYHGVVLAVTVTVAVGTAIYYYFSKETQQRQNPYGGSEQNAYSGSEQHSFDRPGPRQNGDNRPRRTLKKTGYPRSDKNEDNCCTICLEELVTQVKKLSCNHVFHFGCITEWFKIQRNCPNCRRRHIAVPQMASYERHHECYSLVSLAIPGQNECTCTICFKRVSTSGTERRALSCGHIFHNGCITRWVNVFKNCPNCRSYQSA